MTRGEVEAVSAEAAVDLLRRRSLWVIDLEPTRGASASVIRLSGSASPSATPARFLDRLSRRTTDRDESLGILTRSVATLLESGVPLERALDREVKGGRGEHENLQIRRRRSRPGQSGAGLFDFHGEN